MCIRFSSPTTSCTGHTESSWKVRYVEELGEGELHEELAAPNRSYDSGEVIDWQEKIVPFTDFEPINYYDKCYEYYAEGAKPFVPIEKTREIMQLLESCRASSGKEGSGI